MSDPIHFEPRIYQHESGSKFYEVVEIWHPDEKRFLLVRRWGKNSALEGGGEIKFEPYLTLRLCNAAAEKLIDSKEKRGYERVSSGWGLHGCSSTTVPGKLFDTLKRHYNAETAEHICSLLGVPAKPFFDFDEPYDENDIVVEEPVLTPEPIRTAEWGSW